MNHIKYLVGLLRPLGVYDLGAGTRNRAELDAYAGQLDDGCGHLEETAREMSLTTAESFGLEAVEELLPYRPVSPTAAERRAALAALLRIGGDSFTLAAINDTISGCGVNARVEETDQAGTVEVSFPQVPGIPPNFEEIRVIIEDIIPAHLIIQYHYWYLTWQQLEQKFSCWQDIEDKNLTWYGLETYVEPEDET